MIDAEDGLFIRQIWRPALNELFHCGPYEVKASKFLSFFALAASLPFNQPSRRQKMAPPSAFKHSLRQVSGFFGSGGGGTHSPELSPQLLPRGPGQLGRKVPPRPLAVASSFRRSEDNCPPRTSDPEVQGRTWNLAWRSSPASTAPHPAECRLGEQGQSGWPLGPGLAPHFSEGRRSSPGLTPSPAFPPKDAEPA